VKSANATFSFQLKNSSGATESWYINLKDKAEVGKGAAPAGGKADGECYSFTRDMHESIANSST
jgi:hypothetical protein